MKRHRIPPRPGWQQRVEEQGLIWHTQDGHPYWDESAAWEFTAAQVDQLEATAAELHRLYLEAAGEVVRNGWWQQLGIRGEQVDLITRSWEEQEFSLYGRFDVMLDDTGQPKLLEYNADTPTSLLESAVIQWQWLEDTRPEADQFNSLHERLIAAWQRSRARRVHFSAMEDSPEDETTVLYLQDTAIQAGLETAQIAISRIGWNSELEAFVDEEEEEITTLFKLYPWEGMLQDAFARFIPQSRCRFIEPAWKLLLSNKGMLPVLWELFPDHPALLPAYRDPYALGRNYVKKPVHSREGANVTIIENGVTVASAEGPYGDTGHIYQAIARSAPQDGHWPALGLWIVDGEPAGMGIREDTARITGNLSRFVPHWFS